MADKSLKLSIVVAAQDLASGKLDKVRKELAGMGPASRMAALGMGGIALAGKKAAGAFNVLKGRVTGLVGAMGPLLGIAGIGGVTALLTDSISKAEEFAATTAKVSRVTGIAAGQASQLVDTLDKFGISGDSQVTLLARLSKNAGTFAQSQDKAAAATAAAQKVLDNGKSTVKQRQKALADLKKNQDKFGFSVTGTNGKIVDANELLLRSADYFNSTATSTQKAAVFQKLYGRQWTELIPLLSLGSKKLKEELNTALKLTPQQLKDAAALRGAQREFNDELGDTQTLVGLEILPSLTKLVRTAKTFISQNREQIISGIRGAIALAGQIGDAFGAVVKGLSAAWNAIPPPLRDLLVKGFVAEKVIKFAFGFSPAKLIGGAVTGLLTKGLGGLFSRGGSPVTPMYTKEVGGVGGVGGGTGIGGKAGKVLGAVAIVGEALAVWQVWKDQNEQNSQIATDVQQTAVDWLKKGPSKADLETGLRGVEQGITDIRSNPLNVLVQGDALTKLENMRTAIQLQLDALNRIAGLLPSYISGLQSRWEKPPAKPITSLPRPTRGGKTFVSPDMPGPGRAKGGPVHPNQPVIVGEEGPEVLVPKSHGTIVPNKKSKAKATGFPVFVTNWPSTAGFGGADAVGAGPAEKWHLTKVRRGSANWAKLMAEGNALNVHVHTPKPTFSAREGHDANRSWRRVSSAHGNGIAAR